MAKIPVAIKCKQTFYDALMSTEMVRATTVGFPSGFYGLRVYVDDSINDDYEVEYADGPSMSELSTAIATLSGYMAAQNVTLPVDGLETYYKARTHLKMKFDDMSDLSFEPTQDDLAEMSDRTMGKLPWDRKEESE